MTDTFQATVQTFAHAALAGLHSHDDPIRYQLVCQQDGQTTRFWFELKDWPNESPRVVDAEDKMQEAWRANDEVRRQLCDLRKALSEIRAHPDFECPVLAESGRHTPTGAGPEPVPDDASNCPFCRIAGLR